MVLIRKMIEPDPSIRIDPVGVVHELRHILRKFTSDIPVESPPVPQPHEDEEILAKRLLDKKL